MIEIKGRILNASGCWCDTREKIVELYNNPIFSGVISKTCTRYPKTGNPEPNYYFNEKNGLHFNCKGLPNFGYEYYKECFSLLLEKDKPFILSVAYNEHELDDFTWILKDYERVLQEHEKDALIEINISCPNIHSRIPGYHKKDIAFLLHHIRALNLTRVKFGLKLPPYFELEKIRKIAELFLLHVDNIRYIVCCNTIPNAYYDGKYCGVSGKINKYISLGNIKKFKEYCSDKIQLIGSGGITDGQDIHDYVNAGADMVQLGSGFYDKERNMLDADKIGDLIHV
jgi:dihydroorotate dehydrogenase (fumarate)